MLVEKVIKIPVYTFNFRMYPNKEQSELIDRIILALHKACNMAVYDMFENKVNTIERPDQKNGGQTVHFPDVKSIAKKQYLDVLRSRREDIKLIPAGALSGENGVFLCDLSKRLDAQVSGENSNKKTNGKGVKRPIENSKPPYYSKKHPRTSYTYQEFLRKMSFNEENKNVAYFNLAKIGKVKIRGIKGYLKNIRFDCSCGMDFEEYANLHKTQQVLTTVKKDNCGDYFLQLCLKDVYKIVKVEEEKKEIGIDVGISTLMTLSDGTKYDNPRFKNGKDGSVRQHREILNRQLSRRQGSSNIEFREKLRELRKEDINLEPSKRYIETKIKKAKLERKVTRQRKYHMENMVLEVIRRSNFIGIETLSVKDMYVKKNKSEK